MIDTIANMSRMEFGMAAAPACLFFREGMSARRASTSGQQIRTSPAARSCQWSRGSSAPENFFHRHRVTSAATRGQAPETSDSPFRKRLADAARATICGGMNASNQGPDCALDARFLRAVEAWCARNGTTAGAFGAAVCRDRAFVASLREGRCPRLGTVDRALAVMGEPPAAPAFIGEVQAFLAVTGTKRSLLGLKAAGNPSFVAQLLAGVSPKLTTVEAVRAWMAANADTAERREIRACTGPMPSFLAGDPQPSPVSRSRPENGDSGTERPGPRRDERRYMDTREAAEWLGLAPATLARYRTPARVRVTFASVPACGTGPTTWRHGTAGTDVRAGAKPPGRRCRERQRH